MNDVSIIDSKVLSNPVGINSTNIGSIIKTTPKAKESSDNEDFAIYLTTIIFLTLFFFWLAYAISYDLYTNNVTSSSALNQCLPGQCVMDQKTGEKYCPPTNEKYAYNIATQACVYPGICRGILPYGINSDGGSTIDGICQKDPLTDLPLNCRCDNKLNCPDYILASFTTITGNPYGNNTNTQFAQNLIGAYGGDGQAISPPNSGFCSIPLSWMLRSTPGCAGVKGNNDFEIATNCISQSPCLQGIAAFIAENANTVTTSSLNSMAVGCVRPNYFDQADQDRGGCDIKNGYIPFFDRLTNSVMCKLLCKPGYEARYNGGIADGYGPPTGYNGYSCQPICKGGRITYDAKTAGFVCY